MKKAFSPRFIAKIVLLLFMVRLGVIPIQSAIIQHQTPQPQAIFVLGGGREREQAAAKFAQAYPQLPIWISSGSSPDWTKPHFQEAGIPLSRLHLDYCAVDTVTNFTCLIDKLKQQNIHHVYLLTSDFHLPRAQVIGFFVFGSRNIAITPIGIPSRPQPEPWVDTLRDTFRSIIWIFTGRSFMRFHPRERELTTIKKMQWKPYRLP
ncbi:MAG: YdcF family protein [Cyanobacteria bacterium]|nr:YdcF family protein [Cyanobacteria bacterium GSL.Bin1]